MSTADDYPDAFSFDTFDECAEFAEKTWLLKNAIAIGENSTWYGPPGCGKSALLLDMAYHIANRSHWQWHEYMHDEDFSVEPRATVYFALERANLTKIRMGAYKTRDNPVSLPIAVVSETINLLDPDCAEEIIDTVLKFEAYGKCPVGLIIIDTFSKAIANADEDKAQTQNLAAATLKRIHDSLDVHIATIGHTGKNEKAGERGSNARLGHVDLAVQISVNGNLHTATVVKANDQAEGPIALFRMEEVTVRSKNPDGSDREPYSTRILAPYDPHAAKKARPAVFRSPTGKQAKQGCCPKLTGQAITPRCCLPKVSISRGSRRPDAGSFAQPAILRCFGRNKTGRTRPFPCCVRSTYNSPKVLNWKISATPNRSSTVCK